MKRLARPAFSVFALAMLLFASTSLKPRAIAASSNDSTNAASGPFLADIHATWKFKGGSNVSFSQEYSGHIYQREDGARRTEIIQDKSGAVPTNPPKASYRLYIPTENAVFQWNGISANVFQLPGAQGDDSFIENNVVPHDELTNVMQRLSDMLPPHADGITEHTEVLDERKVNDTVATGRRVTRTYAQGSIGNERSFSSIIETWKSARFNLTIKRTFSDPLAGDLDIEISNIRQIEPDATLFEPPKDHLRSVTAPPGRPQPFR
jgi:hypothetical protein